jgi:hypothetical protein
MIRRTTRLVLVATVILGLFAFVDYPIYMSTGANSYHSYGWPNGWLTRNEFKTYVGKGDGPPHIDQHWVRWYISRNGDFAIAVVCSLFGSAALQFLSHRTMTLIKKNKQKRCQPAGGAYVSPAAGDPSAHP